MKILAMPLAAAASLLAAPAFSSVPQASDEARIPFPNRGGVRDFRADGRDALYLRGPGRQWYRATLYGPCIALPWARTIGVDTRGAPVLDRFSTLVVGGERCQIESLVRSDPPPRRERGRN